MEAQELMKRIGQNLSVHRAFGPAYEREGVLIIPVAFVAGGGGAGEGPISPGPGAPPMLDGEDAEQDPGAEPPTGTGAGFGGMVMPVGVYVVSGDDVRWKPALNVTMLAMSGLGVLRLVLRLRARVLLRRHAPS